jgi:bacillithiol biosynthesis cysteine-adding enzyme BshC
MKIENVSYNKTNLLNQLIADYLNEASSVKPFYNQSPSIESFEKQIQIKKSHPVDRQTLLKTLKEQYSAFECSALTKNNIELLALENTFTITTGHQLNLFTGPLFFIYKILSAINLTQQLKEKYPTNNFVPVYWMATEDHDFEEINHFNFFGKTYSVTRNKNGAVGSVFLENIDELFKNLEADFKDRPQVLSLIERLKIHYVKNKPLAACTRSFVNDLFKDFGLVILDANDKSLKNLFKPEIIKEIFENTAVQNIENDSKKLTELGYKTQLTPRDINLFYIGENFRERIVKEETFYKVLNTNLKFTKEELINEIETHIERFSPNVALRPLYQEKILPNLAYIGGAGEIAYWLQLKTTFEAFNIPFPLIILRKSIVLLNEKDYNQWKAFGFLLEDFTKEISQLINEYVQNNATIDFDFNREERLINDAFEVLKQKAIQTDKSLVGKIEAEKAKTTKQLKQLQQRLLKAVKQKEEINLKRIKKIYQKVFPNGVFQERFENILYLWLFLNHTEIQEITPYCNPLEKEITFLIN